MTDALRQELERQIEGEVRFDRVSRALYSTDASVYQIEPLGVVVPRSREDVVRTVQIAARHGCSITARGGGTSQAGQAIGSGLQLDTSKYLNRILDLNVDQRWAWVEPLVPEGEAVYYESLENYAWAPLRWFDTGRMAVGLPSDQVKSPSPEMRWLCVPTDGASAVALRRRGWKKMVQEQGRLPQASEFPMELSDAQRLFLQRQAPAQTLFHRP